MPYLETRDLPIYYESHGQGPALVFAHGAGGNAAIWFNQIAHFSPNYQVIAFDHRCFGRTGVPAAPLTVHDFRDDLLALLDQLDIEQAHLVGQSMGGFTALRTTLDVPDRVASLTMSATGGGIYNPNPSEAFRKMTSSEDAKGVLETMSAKSSQNPALMQLYTSINNFNVNFSWSRLATLLGPDDVIQVEELASIATSTLFIAGAEDPLFPPDLLASYAPHFQQANIEIVQDSGHSPYFEQPNEFNQLLERHIAGGS